MVSRFSATSLSARHGAIFRNHPRSFAFQGKPGRLKGDLLHYTVRSLEEHEQKVEQYTTLAAQQMFTAGRRTWRAAMWLASPWSWFNNYVLRLGFLDGYRRRAISRMAAARHAAEIQKAWQPHCGRAARR